MGAKKGFTHEHIIGKLREAEVLMSKGASVAYVCRKIGVTYVTFYRWRKLYGGMQVSEAKRLKEVEKENARLRKLVADLSFDNAILKEVSRSGRSNRTLSSTMTRAGNWTEGT